MNMDMNRIKIFVGPGGSGKTKAAIQLARSLLSDGKKVAAFKAYIDTRGVVAHLNYLTSRDGKEVRATRVKSASQILNLLDYSCMLIDGSYGVPDVILIDEAQFFGRDIIRVVEQLMRQHKKVIITGLARDCFGRPFRFVPQLMALAECSDDIVVKQSVCAVCRQLGATQIQRLINGQPALLGRQVIVGEDQDKFSQSKTTYEPRCSEHHLIGQTNWLRKVYFDILYRLQN